MRYTEVLLYVVLITPTFVFAGDLRFRKHDINEKADYSAAALIDVNCDGKVDVVCGGDWYEAPTWKRHAAADVPRIGGRPDGFSHLVLDINRDGLDDVITVNYRSRSIKWMEHPGTPDLAWKLHLVTEPGPMETGRLVDVDGDGQLDLLPNGKNFAAWWELRWKDKSKKSEPAWIRHELPIDAKGHGQGFGDVNGDGRNDIVGQFGWLQSPPDARSGKWQWHPEFNIERGSVPMLVVDPDEDGDNDIVWCSAHGFGVYWLEQTKDADGKRAWQRHAIDTSWSQCHAPLWADMDGDGRNELIAGKRYMAHGGSDPGAYDPLVVYRYQFNLATKTWDRWTVSSGERVGLGLDPKVGDIDGDGDLDLLACGRSGLYWLENQGVGTTKVVDTALLENAPIDRLAKWGHRRSQLDSAIQNHLGSLPNTNARVALQITTTEPETSDAKFKTRQIQYSFENGRRVAAKIFVPNDARPSSTSGIVCLFDDELVANQTARDLASQGNVCIVPTIEPCEGNPVMNGVWQVIRAVDVLQATPEVHAERIGFVGDSQSGALGLYVAALDQRFLATVTNARRMPVHANAGYSATELVAMVAPRALQISIPNEAKWKRSAEQAIEVYDLRKAKKQLKIVATESVGSKEPLDWLQGKLRAR